jgi:glycosyltransferase involved in cell wall biosynthesis
MEQHLGHRTYYENLRRWIETDARVDAHWVPITYSMPDGFLEKLQWLPARVRSTLRARSQVREGLRNFAADITFYNTQVPAAIGGMAVRRHPYIIATDLTPIQYDALGPLYGHAPDTRSPLKTYKYYINRSLFRGAALLLPWSVWAKESMVSDYGVDPSRIEVMPPGVDLSIWRPVQREQTGPLRILFVGGDFERKGGPTLLRAFQALDAGSAQLHVVTRSRLPETPWVFVYNGMVPNSAGLIALFQHCDVFVLPSEAEAFGIAAVEATAVGLPVIASHGCALAEIVADGETGFLVGSRDERALVERLRMLASDSELRLRLSRAARHRAELRFDAKRNAVRLIDRMFEISERQSRRVVSGVPRRDLPDRLG